MWRAQLTELLVTYILEYYQYGKDTDKFYALVMSTEHGAVLFGHTKTFVAAG